MHETKQFTRWDRKTDTFEFLVEGQYAYWNDASDFDGWDLDGLTYNESVAHLRDKRWWSMAHEGHLLRAIRQRRKALGVKVQ